MSQTSPETTEPSTTPDANTNGFDIVRPKRWPWVVGVLVIAALVAGFVIYRNAGGSESANTTAGATLNVVYLDSNPAEQKIIELSLIHI